MGFQLFKGNWESVDWFSHMLDNLYCEFANMFISDRVYCITSHVFFSHFCGRSIYTALHEVVYPFAPIIGFQLSLDKCGYPISGVFL